MRLLWHKTTTKVFGDHRSNNEDAFLRCKTRGEDISRFVMCDGATSSYAARVWSNALVSRFAETGEISDKDRVYAAAKEYEAKYPPTALAGMDHSAIESFKRGSSSTLLLVEQDKSNRNLLHLTAVGDTCFFVVDDKYHILKSFPLENSSDFSTSAYLITVTFEGLKQIDAKYIATIAVAYVPVAFVVFAEHIADHKNLSSIIGQDLIKEPGLHRTLLGDGIGSMAGAFFGGCPNTTYGESVGCVAITGNASIVTILATAILAIAASFCAPFVTFLSTIPNCVMGGVCITLYGFIAVSGLKMLQPVDLNDNRNLFTASVILIAGIGGMTLKIGSVTLTEVACALILGIVVNLLFNRKSAESEK